MQALKTELLKLLHRDDLLRSSLVLGKIQNSAFCQEFHVEKILELAARVWHRTARRRNDVILLAQAINHVLYKDFGLVGKGAKQVIDDPSRYYLHEVLEKRQGSPLTLAVLYCVMAEQVGLGFECLALSSHYLLKVSDVTGEFYIDPYDGGRFLTEMEFQKKFRSALQKSRLSSTSLYEKINIYQLVSRLIQQLKHTYILKGKALEALRSVELLTALFPRSPELTRDRGILYCEMEYFSKAMLDLRYYLRVRPNANDVREIKKLASMLKGYREVMN